MNEKLAKIFQQLSLYESYRANHYPAITFAKASNVIKALTFEIKNIDQLDGITGIGKSCLEVINEFLTTGESNRHQEALKIIGGIDNLAAIKGVGVMKAAKLNAVGIFSASYLREATKNLLIGEEILSSGVHFIKAMQIGLEFEAHTDKTRMSIQQHDEIATPIIDELKSYFFDVAAVGSRRRWDGKDPEFTVGDIVIIVQTYNKDAHKYLRKFFDVVMIDGESKISGIKNRRQIDFRMTTPECWGAMLLHGTGSAKFNMKLRCLALAKDMTLSEYGLKDKNTGKIVASKTEEEIFSALGIPFIEPWNRNIK